MYVLKIEIHPIRDGEAASGTILEQRRQGDGWANVREHTLNSSDASGKRNIALQDDMRLIVGGKSATEIVWNKEQNAAVSVNTAVKPVPTQHPQVKKYSPPRHEDEGTNDTGVPLVEQSAYEYEMLKRNEMIAKVRAENEQRAREAAERAKAEQDVMKDVVIDPSQVEAPVAAPTLPPLVMKPASMGVKK